MAVSLEELTTSAKTPSLGKLPLPVLNERDTTGLRRLYDKIETHHRGLKALEVNTSTYEGIVVPAILGKLPEAVKLQIT